MSGARCAAHDYARGRVCDLPPHAGQRHAMLAAWTDARRETWLPWEERDDRAAFPVALAAHVTHTATMPGSGPIDPTRVWNLIHGGAVYANGLLDGQHLRVGTSNAWEVTTANVYTLTQNGYDKLAVGAIQNGYIVAGGGRYKLAVVGSTADAVSA